MLPTLEDALRSRETLRVHHIAAIDAEVLEQGYNDDNTFWHKVRISVQNLSTRYSRSGLPIVFYEYDLRELWYKLIQGAKITDAKHPAQDRLAAEVLHAREMGTLSRKIAVPVPGLQGEGPRHWNQEEALTSDGRIWADLPFLVEAIYEPWKNALELPARQRRNPSAFIARLASWGVRDPDLCLCALWILRDALETPRPLVSTATNSENDLLPIEDMVPAAVVWFELCGHKIESLCLMNYDFDDSAIGSLARDDGVDPTTGFSISRWHFWKRRLDELSTCGHEETAAFALRGADCMKFWGERISSLEQGQICPIALREG
ncbi:hypothetical protein Aspvir_004920 [Aspergillus viridinutans]|uniref:Uncharacterized protein n=1 Tax=Aspergillus viridinutans TaxID=75553 RepID=A0A9P3BWI0_ASPVI|nr:uncharacterized protein Aspvir_004920 [Aspergillus viridinutans]GIK00891.1 hypothetical protein Aspvir_004920 [Aspergillus viridinutans]